MPIACLALGARSLIPRPWRALTDLEFAELRVRLPGGNPDADQRGRGRPPKNLRQTLDAIFWIAAGTLPWKELAPELGKPDTANRTLRRWARVGVVVRSS